ncbi:hypothetical protein A2U01_0048434 [Trifolium medium]|uniref:Uncharacterized protein n=1 Tax=Trifolium medium TaxID=97028 RepID=A0A392QUN4_9FABA|nr:hypothetical protein [Trifolium medium]
MPLKRPGSFFSCSPIGEAAATVTKKIQAMEKQAIEDMVLESTWVGDSKMPSAAVTRTQPVLESIAP